MFGPYQQFGRHGAGRASPKRVLCSYEVWIGQVPIDDSDLCLLRSQFPLFISLYIDNDIGWLDIHMYDAELVRLVELPDYLVYDDAGLLVICDRFIYGGDFVERVQGHSIVVVRVESPSHFVAEVLHNELFFVEATILEKALGDVELACIDVLHEEHFARSSSVYIAMVYQSNVGVVQSDVGNYGP